MTDEDLETLRKEVGQATTEDNEIEERRRLLAERKRLKQKNHPSLIGKFFKAASKEIRDAISNK